MSKLRWILLGLVAILAPLSIYLLVVANGADYDIEYTREIPSKLTVTYLGKVLGDLQSWPTWFHSTVHADQVDFSETPYPLADQRIVAGARIRLALDLHRPHGKSNLLLGVLQYIPGQRLSMRILKDSKSSLTHLFEPLDWTLELKPVPAESGKPESSLIRGTVKAHTHSWRARVFGKIAAKALLNQVFYPDLFILAEVNNPDVVYPDPDAQHGGM